jgi:dienelactone hydrolase
LFFVQDAQAGQPRQEQKENVPMIATRALSLAVAGLLLSALPLKASETIAIPSNPIPTAPGAHPAPGPLSGELSLPTGQGPFPVVILLHGCNGISRANMRRWSDRLTEWGYGAFVLDSFRGRNVTSVCAPEDQPKVTPLDRAGDVLNAALALSSHPAVDGKRIGVIGFSHGGSTAVTVTRKAFEKFQPGLIKASINYYGSCRGPEVHGTTPLLSLNGDADTWGNPATTCAAFQSALPAGAITQLHTYQGVVHSFDNPDINPGRVVLGHPTKYDWTASRDSYERSHAFLDQFVRDAKR